MKLPILIILLITGISFSQSIDGISNSMAGNYATMSRGVNALSYNPANLALPRGNTMELNIFSLNTNVFNNSFSVASYNKFLTEEGHGGELSDSEKQDFLKLFPNNEFRLDYSLSNNWFGFAYNNFGLSTQVISQGKIEVNNIVKPIGIMFEEEFDPEYQYKHLNAISANAFAALKITAGYAYPLDLSKFLPGLTKTSVGIAWNQYLGYGVVQSQESDIFLQRVQGIDDEESVVYDIRMRGRTAYTENGSPVGNGFGVDFGISGGYGKRLCFSWSFTNIGGHINWGSNTEQFEMIMADSVLLEDFDPEATDTTLSIGSFSTPLPAVMRMGAVYRMTNDWKISAEYHQGLNQAFGNSTTVRLGAGTEYFLYKFLPLRTGLAFGGKEGTQFGLGFGLYFANFQFDYSYAMKGWPWPSYAKGYFNAFSFKLVF